VDIERGREWRGLLRFSHEAMATLWEVCTLHPDPRYAAQAAQAAFDLADGLERDLSRFLPNSDVGRINHLRAGERTQVSPSTLECLVIAHHAFILTAGAFDVSLGTGLPSLQVDPDGLWVRATRDGVQLDLGGIGKGYAVDRMAALLEEWGLYEVLVHGGFSSVLALEPPPGRDGWPLTLSDPGDPSRTFAHLRVRQTALGASGLRKGEHIIDPRTGGPVSGRRAAWAAVTRSEAPGSGTPADPAPRVAAAAVADAVTTAFMVMSTEAIEALCDANPDLEVWILEEPGVGQRERAGLRHVGGSPSEPDPDVGGAEPADPRDDSSA
jgi:thiamine biosynthesis lipoprotein